LRRPLLACVAHALALAGAISALPAQAQDDAPIETLEVTMQLLPEGATLPDAVTRVIELPPAARDTAAENAAKGLDRANAARAAENPGRETAAEARERGRDNAQEARENIGRGRGNGPPEDVPGPPQAGGPPDDLPTPPGPPDDVEPPGRGGGPPGNP
jgi:hypothetical protein